MTSHFLFWLSVSLQLSEILKFGVDKLLSSEESSVQDVQLEKILGPSRDGQWVEDKDTASPREEEEDRRDSEEQSMFHTGCLTLKTSVLLLLKLNPADLIVCKILLLIHHHTVSCFRPHVLL